MLAGTLLAFFQAAIAASRGLGEYLRLSFFFFAGPAWDIFTAGHVTTTHFRGTGAGLLLRLLALPRFFGRRRSLLR